MRGTVMVQEQALRKAKAALQEAEEKLRRTKRWCQDYDRVVQPLLKKLENLHYYLEHDLPKAVHLMEQLSRALEGYAQVTLDTSPAPTPNL
jgi:DnaJ-domain-containing protein 1